MPEKKREIKSCCGGRTVRRRKPLAERDDSIFVHVKESYWVLKETKKLHIMREDYDINFFVNQHLRKNLRTEESGAFNT